MIVTPCPCWCCCTTLFEACTVVCAVRRSSSEESSSLSGLATIRFKLGGGRRALSEPMVRGPCGPCEVTGDRRVDMVADLVPLRRRRTPCQCRMNGRDKGTSGCRLQRQGVDRGKDGCPQSRASKLGIFPQSPTRSFPAKEFLSALIVVYLRGRGIKRYLKGIVPLLSTSRAGYERESV